MIRTTPSNGAPLRILFLLRDALPAFRPDVDVLFGRALPTLGITSDLVGMADERKSADPHWPGGRQYACPWRRGTLKREFSRLLQYARSIPLGRQGYALIQARDTLRGGLIGLLAARLARKPFVYWMSFPFVESFAERAKEIARTRGPLAALPFQARAWLARWVFYGVLVRQADHIFVQSASMQAFMHCRGVPQEKMTPVPMGVDIDAIRPETVIAAREGRLLGRRVLVYLGALAYARRSEFLLEVVAAVRATTPEVLLILAGDASSDDERAWIRTQISEAGLSDHVWLTGWLPQAEALPLVKAAEVGLSPIPRGELFDVSSPTKAQEYLALGIPCVGNDIPDQRWVLEESGAGYCVPMKVTAFAEAIQSLLDNPATAASMGARGPDFIRRTRAYPRLAEDVAHAYRRVLKP